MNKPDWCPQCKGDGVVYVTVDCGGKPTKISILCGVCRGSGTVKPDEGEKEDGEQLLLG